MFGILNQISWNFVLKGPIGTKLVFVYEMAWHWTGDKAFTWTNEDKCNAVCVTVRHL